jgi:hypothetical protein
MGDIIDLDKNFENRPWVSNFFSKDSLVVHAEYSNIFWNNDNIKIAESIRSQMIATGKNKLVFMAMGDGFAFSLMDIANDIVKYLIETDALIIDNVMYVSAAHNTESNIKLYAEHCKTHNWIPLKLGFLNTWELSTHQIIKGNSPEAYQGFDTTPRLKSKNTLCFNRRATSHRWYTVAEFIKRGLLEKSYFSFYQTIEDHNIDSSVLKENYQSIVDILDNNKELFPMEINITIGQYWDNLNEVDMGMYNDSYFSLITETKFFKDMHFNCGHLDQIFLTEKTFRTIGNKHPFILMSRPWSLRALVADGYKTFHPYIDETYDTIEDDELRLKAILDETERLHKLTDQEWLDFQTAVEPILLHNFNVITNRGESLFLQDERFRNEDFAIKGYRFDE